MTLISASNQPYVDAVSEHLGLFEAAVGSDAETNLKSRRKLRRIQAITEGGDFTYVGDSRADLPIWSRAKQIVMVNCAPAMSDQFASRAGDVLNFGSASAVFRPLLRAMAQEHLAVSCVDPVALDESAGTAVRGRGPFQSADRADHGNSDLACRLNLNHCETTYIIELQMPYP